MGNGFSCRESQRRARRWHLRCRLHPWRGGAGKVEASGKQKRQSFALKQGIDRDAAKLIVGLIKDAKLKVLKAALKKKGKLYK